MRSIIILILVLATIGVSVPACRAATCSQYYRIAGTSTLDTTTWQVADSVIAVRFDTTYGGSIPAGFASTIESLDNLYDPGDGQCGRDL